MELDKGKAIKNNGTYYKECQHDCTEKKIGYECVCNEGYELAPDKHSCTGRTLTGFTGFAQVTKQVHIPMNLLTLLFITVIFRVYIMHSCIMRTPKVDKKIAKKRQVLCITRAQKMAKSTP